MDAQGADARPTPGPTILPVLLINAQATITKNDKVPCTLKVVEHHDGTLKDIDKQAPSIETPCGVRYRGNWSLQFPKKSISLELRNAAGDDRDLPLGGMPAESDWVLRAGYYDKTLIRDAFALWMFREVWGRYAPRARMVEVYVNGKYEGVYTLAEKIKRGKNRVNIPKVAPDAMTGDLTGGYMIHLESGGNGPGFKTSTGRVWDYGYPRGPEVTPAQATYIRDFTDRFEKAMAAADFAHPTNGYIKWIDRPSWVDFGLFQELSRNTDGYTKSSFYQKLPDSLGGKWVKGPVWDFDLAYGNFRNGSEATDRWLYEFRWNQHVPWWEPMWRDAPFRNAARCRWQELRKDKLSTRALHAQIDALAASLALAQPRENARWKLIGVRQNQPFVGMTYAEDVKYLKDWVARRITWLDTNLVGCQP